MNAKAEPVANIAGSSGSPNERTAVNPRRLFFDFGFTGVLIAGFVLGALYFASPAFGQPRQPAGIIVLAALLPSGLLVVLSLIERLVPPAGPRKSFRSWLLHLQIALFSNFIYIPAGILAGYISMALSRHLHFSLGLIDLSFASGKGLLVVFAAVWVSAILYDFFFYWMHRAQHKSSILWQHHKMHHMDPELEALSVSRQNWIEAFMEMLAISLPLGILFKGDSFDAQTLGVLGSIIAAVYYTLLTLGHLNVRFQVGWASLFFCSPQIHRIHHSRLPQHHDKNFAFVLPLWDVLFGTYYPPARDEFPPSGVEGEKEIQSFWESQIFTQREWWRMFRAWRRRRTGSAPA